jgi:hypothetical protein
MNLVTVSPSTGCRPVKWKIRPKRDQLHTQRSVADEGYPRPLPAGLLPVVAAVIPVALPLPEPKARTWLWPGRLAHCY